MVGSADGLGLVVSGAAVSLLALCSALVKPWAGRARDAGRVWDVVGMAGGLGLAAAGMLLAALVSGVGGVLAATVAIGAAVGVATPLGFARLAEVTPTERHGQTMGATEVGRELGDAGGPLMVGALARAATLGIGFLGLAVLVIVIGLAVLGTRTEATGTRG